jgi:hypothetical protein
VPRRGVHHPFRGAFALAVVVSVAVVLPALAAGCSSGAPEDTVADAPVTGPSAPPLTGRASIPANARFDYQIGGAYPPQPGVTVVARDRLDAPVSGIYNICYVNGFQAQTADEAWWLSDHPTLVLHDAAGRPVKDTQWNELILDIRTEPNRRALAQIVGPWLEGCGAAGFQGVDLDNLDTYDRSGGLITEDDAVAYARVLRRLGLGHRVHPCRLRHGVPRLAEPQHRAP